MSANKPDRDRSLRETLGPDGWLLAFLVLAAMVLLAFGLCLQTLKVQRMVFWTDTFSVLSGVRALWHEQHRFLAVVVFVFSVAFPILKLTSLLYVWGARMNQARRRYVLRALGGFGKWSMLDVFVVALIIVLAKAGALLKAEPRPGIYVFGAAVFLSMVVTVLFETASRRASKPRN